MCGVVGGIVGGIAWWRGPEAGGGYPQAEESGAHTPDAGVVRRSSNVLLSAPALK